MQPSKDLEEKFTPNSKLDLRFDEESLEKASTDYSHIKVIPDAVAFPKNNRDIRSIVHFINQNKAAIPRLSLTVRSGGADLTGGPINESIILDVNAKMNQIIELTKDHAWVQPGLFYRDFNKETVALGSFLPSYPASRDVCCVGGMVGNNSGGPKSYKYGKTERFIEALKVVFSDGNEYLVQALTEGQLQSKISQRDFEGQAYRELFHLLESNYDVLQKAKPKVSKNSAGYSLWDVWDCETKRFDLTKLFTGSQGTLGIVTEIKFRLVPNPEHRKLMVIFIDDLKKVTDVVSTLAEHHPEEIEMYHRSVLKIILRHFPTFAETLKVNPFSFGFQFYEEAFEILKTNPMIPEALILPKFAGDSAAEVDRAIEETRAALSPFDLPIYVTETASDRARYRKLRHDTFYFFQHHLGGKQEVIVFDDLCVRPDQLSYFLPKLVDIIEQCDCEYFMAGHIGDGNIHLVPFMDPTQKGSQKLIYKMTEELYKLTLELKGSISGEHNDGLTRTPFIPQMYGEEVYSLFERTKQIFDPQNIFNPGKKIQNEKTKSLQYALDHMTVP